MSLSTLLDTATMAKLFETRDHISASLIKSARTDGKTNTITLKAENTYLECGDIGSEEVVVLVNDSVGFGCLTDVEDADNPGDFVAVGNVLGFPLDGTWRNVHTQIEALFAFITHDLDGEWELVKCY